MRNKLKKLLRFTSTALLVFALFMANVPLGLFEYGLEKWNDRNVVDLMWQAKHSGSVVDSFVPRSALAAASFYVGQFQKLSGTGSQEVNGPSFQPKALIFYWTNGTTNNFTNVGNTGIGFVTATDNERAVTYWSDAGANSNSGRGSSNSSAIVMTTTAGTAVGAAELTSMDADGFTLNWTTSDANAYNIQYIAIGGDDIANATSSTFSMTTSGATQQVTGVGFQPDFLFFLPTPGTTNGTFTTADAFLHLGFAAGASSEGLLAIGNEDGEGSAVTCSFSDTSTSILSLVLSENSCANIDAQADLATFDADGFTINKTNLPAANTNVFYLAIEGGQWAAGTFNKRTSAGSQSVSGLAFQPVGVFLTSYGSTTATLAQEDASAGNNAELSIGAASGASSEGAVWAYSDDADTSPDPDSLNSSTSTIYMGTSPSGTPAIDSQADLTSFDATGFTLSWLKSNSTADEVLYWVVGDNVPTPIKVSGTLYSDEGSTAITTAGIPIKLVVGTSTPGIYSTTTCSGCGGFFEFNGSSILTSQFALGTPFHVYVDNSAIDASTVTKASSTAAGSNITGLNLYQNRLIVRHEATSATSTLASDLGKYDGDNDPDIRFKVDGSNNLSVASSTELHIWTGDTFAPEGSVTVHGNQGSGVDGSIHIDDSAVFTPTGAVTLAGSWAADTGSTFTSNSSDLTFNATTTGKTIAGTLTGSSALGSTTFNGSGGGWTFSNNASTTGFTITNGSVVAPSFLSASGTVSNAGSFDHNSGTFIFNGTNSLNISGTWNTSTTDFATTTFLGSGTKRFANNASTTGFVIGSGVTVSAPSLLSVSGSYSNSGSFTDNSGVVLFDGAGQTISGTLNSATTDFSTTTFLGSGTKTISSNASTTGFVIGSGVTVSAPSLLSVSGSYSNSGSFTDNTGIVLFDGAGQTIAGTLNSATTDFASTTFLGSGTKTFSNNASTTGFTIGSGVTVSAPSFLSIGASYSNSGSFTSNSGTVLFDGADQNISGTLNTSATDFSTTTFLGSGTKSFLNNASTTGFVIGSGVTVSAPSFLSVFASYSNAGSFTDNNGTVLFTGGNISGTLNTATTDFANLVVFVGTPMVFVNNASTTNLTIQSSGSVVAPSLLSISGNYSNSGNFDSNSGTVYLSGSSQQTLSGQMTGTNDDFNNLTILNTSGTGGGTQSIVFGAAASTTGTFTMVASTSAQFLAGATSTIGTLSLNGGASATRIWLRSSSAGSPWNLVVSGSPVVSYVDVRDSYACDGSTIDADDETNFDSTGNTCWDFTAPVLITVDGTLYSDEGTTAITTAGLPIRLVIGTSTPGDYSTTTCSGCGGLFRFRDIDAGAFGIGTPFLVWVNSTQTLRASAVTKASSTSAGANITGLNLYQNRLIVKHEGTSGTSTTNADLGKFDGDNDSDIMYRVSGSDLALSSSTELHIWTGKTFAPGGAVTVHGNASTSAQDGTIHIDDSAVFTAGGLVKLAGSFAADTGSTFTPHADGLLFNATTTGKTLAGTLTGSSALGSTTFSGTNGAWSFSNNASTTNLLILAGTVTFPPFLSVSGDYTLNGSVTTASQDSTALFDGTTQALSGTLNTGTTDFHHVRFAGSGTKTISVNASTTGAFTIDSGATVVAPSQLTVSGNYSNSGTFTHNGGTLFFATTSSGTQTISGTLTGTSAFNNVIIGGPLASTTWSNNASTSNLTITTNSTTTAPSLLSIIGNYSNSGLFKSNSGTVFIASTTGPQTFSGTLSGTSAFNNLTLLAGAAAATTTFSATTTVSGTFTAAVPSTRIEFPIGATTTLQNLTVTGSGGSEVYLHGNGGSGPMDGFTKLLLHMDGSDQSTTFTDSSSPAKTITANGNAQVDTAQSKFGGASGLFDGTGDYLTSSDNSDFEVPGDYTIDVWVRANSLSSVSFIAGKPKGAPIDGNQYYGPYIIRHEISGVFFYSSSSGTSWDIALGEPFGQISTGVWHHIAVSRSGNDYFMFKDGVLVNSFSSSLTPVNNSGSLMIGRFFDTNDWNGWIDEFRISKGIARWTDDFTPPTYPYAAPWKLDVSGSRSVSYANIKDSFACTSAGNITTSNSTDNGGNNTCWTFPAAPEAGDLVLANHAAGQYSNIFTAAGSYPDANAFAFSLATTTEAVDISSLIIDMSSIRGISTGDVTNAQLFVDYDGDTVVDAGDLQVGGAGSVSITGISGTTTFSTSFQATTTRSYIFQADFASIAGSDRVRLSLPTANITATGASTLQSITPTGASAAAFHYVSGSFGGGGSGGEGIDNTPPAGQGTQTGGSEGGGSEGGGAPPGGQGQQGGGGSGGGGEVYVPLPRVLAFCQGDLLCTLSTYFLGFAQYNSR